MERKNKKTKSVGNGEGTLYKSESLNRWIYQYYFNGKRFTIKQRKNEGIKEFKARITKIKNELNVGTYVEKKKETLYSICSEIVEDKKMSNKICLNTYKRSIYTLSYIKNGNIADMPIQNIDSKMIKDFLQTITKYAQTTIDKIYQLLSQAFRRAVDRRYIIENPMLKEECEKPRSNKKTKIVTALSINEEQKLISVLQNEEKNHKYANLILLMLFTGMRVGETVVIRHDYIKSQLEKNENYFYVYDTITRDENDKFFIRKEGEGKTKTIKSTRIIDITPEVRFILKNCVYNYVINPDNLLFYDAVNCSPITPPEINSYLHRINKKYDIAKNLHNHMLRHTFATRLIEAGTDVDVIQNKLGHKKIETTINTYCTLFELRKNRQNELINNYYKENNITLSI